MDGWPAIPGSTRHVSTMAQRPKQEPCLEVWRARHTPWLKQQWQIPHHSENGPVYHLWGNGSTSKSSNGWSSFSQKKILHVHPWIVESPESPLHPPSHAVPRASQLWFINLSHERELIVVAGNTYSNGPVCIWSRQGREMTGNLLDEEVESL